MEGLFKLPSGRAIRSRSQRRYVLIYDGRFSPCIIRRSNYPDRLRRERTTEEVIIDTVTGEVVR